MIRATLLCLVLCCTHLMASAQAQGNMKYRNSQGIDRRDREAQGEQNQMPSQDNAARSRSRSNTTTGGYMGYEQHDSIIVLTANVLLNLTATDHVAIYSLTQVGQTADSTSQAMEENIQRFIGKLATLGIPRENVFIDMISLEPRFEYEEQKKIFNKKFKEVPKGFELKKNVHVRYAEDQKFNDIMLAAAACEIYDLIKVDYFVPEIDKAYERMRKEAARIVLDKKSNYEKVGVIIDSTYARHANESINSYYPADRYFDYTTAGSVSLDAARKKAGDPTIKIEKNVTQYYHKLAYNAYDMVINPTVLEPAVQFVYTLRVKYTLPWRRKPHAAAAPKPAEPVYYIIDDQHRLVMPVKKEKP